MRIFYDETQPGTEINVRWQHHRGARRNKTIGGVLELLAGTLSGGRSSQRRYRRQSQCEARCRAEWQLPDLNDRQHAGDRERHSRDEGKLGISGIELGGDRRLIEQMRIEPFEPNRGKRNKRRSQQGHRDEQQLRHGRTSARSALPRVRDTLNSSSPATTGIRKYPHFRSPAHHGRSTMKPPTGAKAISKRDGDAGWRHCGKSKSSRTMPGRQLKRTKNAENFKAP